MNESKGYDEGKYEVYAFDDESGEYVLQKPESYFVLRRGDILATSTLWSYLGNLSTMIDLDDSRIADGYDPVMPALDRMHLEELRDSVQSMAIDWQHAHRQLPD